MKIAILADIHGNRQAMETVIAHIDTWQPDQVVVNGDTVNRGPCSLACWQTIAARMADDGWLHTMGNHEGYHLGFLQKGFNSDLERRIFMPLAKAHQELNGTVNAFKALPPQVSLYAPDGSELRVTHASMLGQRDSIFADNPLTQLREQISPPPAVFVTAHTHKAFQQQVDETLLVNSGSVGTPADQDARASYAQIGWENGRWQAQIIRLTYNREATIQDYKASGFLSDDDFFAQLIFKEWLETDYYAGPWMDIYYDDVKAGKIGLETAVIQYLQQRVKSYTSDSKGKN